MNGDLKKKLIIAGAISPFVFIIFFIVIIFVPVGLVLGIVDFGGDSSSDGYAYEDYSSTSDNTGYYWPIGSSETTTVNGRTFATGNPSSTTITAWFAGNDGVHRGSHGAIDISAVVGKENVIATKDGIVTYPDVNDNISIGTCDYYGTKANCSSYGNYVMIDHGDGTVSLYGHLYANSITVKKGDYVKQGQVIAKSGSSGNSTGGHLHFEIRIKGKKADPLEYVSVEKPRPSGRNRNGIVEEIQ